MINRKFGNSRTFVPVREKIKMDTWKRREGLWVLTLAIMAILVSEAVFFGFDPQRIYLKSPNIGDSAHWYAAAKIMVEEGWLFHSARLSWPWGLDIAGFPFSGMLDFVIFRLVACFTDNIFKIAAYALVGCSVMSALMAYAMMRALGCNRFFAFIFSLIFAFSPNLYYRNIHHFHSLGYMAPVGAGLAVLVFSGKKRLSLRLTYILFGLAFLAGFSYAYTVAFSLFFLVIAIFRQIIAPSEGATFRNLGCKLLISMLFGFVLSSLPSLYILHNNPELKEKLISFKVPSEADTFGLYIRSLLRPVPVRQPIYREVEKKYAEAHFRNDTGEQTSARLGTTASLGFLFLVLYALGLARIRVIHEDAERKRLFFSLSSLTLAAVLLAVPGGFGSMINMISAQIRCYNRISPFIAFFALTAWGLLLTGLYQTRPQWRTPRAHGILGLAMALLLGFAVGLDQRPISGRLFTNFNETIYSAQSMLHEFAPIFPKDAKILFLPVLTYPIRNSAGHMPSSGDVTPYLMDNGNYYWSIMPLGYEAQKQLLELVKLRGYEFLYVAHNFGYNTILYDTKGDSPEYIDLITSLNEIGLIKNTSKDGRYVIFTNIFPHDK